LNIAGGDRPGKSVLVNLRVWWTEKGRRRERWRL